MRERLVEDLLFFLERPSVTGAEKRLCDDLEERLRELSGWEVRRTGNNLAVRRASRDSSRPLLLFAGHLDTVPEPEGGIPVRIEGARIYGRGASDMKAGDAVMLALIEDFDWSASWAEPLFVFYEREEGPHAENGLEAVFEEMPWVLEAELALVLEPTAGALEAGCAGTAQVEVTFHGKAAHAARPWQGENAISKAGRFLQALHEREPEKVEVEGLAFYDVLTPTMARGGSARNVVPASFWINVNHRFPPERGIEHVRETFEALLGGEASFEIADFAPSGPVDLRNPLLERLLATGVEVRPKQAWTDVARLAERGVAAVNYGPGLPSQAHQDGEHAEIPLLEECYRRLEGFLSASRTAT
ncbi:Putative succinyl-diaminopimelate desuccinylase DapE [Rubrobacter xylanophilus DSM 9941]|uniref:succinyl-diaminopimelate desuccinylase n=1 Tax=Rubrobacter xylanophilus TaxID=49319 RepID=UPI001C63B820|nr:succinyl-diaminopimelate desuccinylase [Rubrobacter xylanophilus]QYJ16284.1 Putative succinyl-diaminopimelate desuccinylase DapE [Rubrobacter xylanophilus DSM 9941]